MSTVIARYHPCTQRRYQLAAVLKQLDDAPPAIGHVLGLRYGLQMFRVDAAAHFAKVIEDAAFRYCPVLEFIRNNVRGPEPAAIPNLPVSVFVAGCSPEPAVTD